MLKKIFKNIYVFFSILFLFYASLRIGYQIVLTVNPKFGYRYEYVNAPKIKSISTFGSENQYVSVNLDSRYVTGSVSMSQNYLITVDIKNRIDPRANRLKIDTGEAVDVTLYDLNTSNFEKKKISVLPILHEHSINRQVISVTAITSQGKDYLSIRTAMSDSTSNEVWYDIEKKEVTPPTVNDITQEAYQSLGENFDLGIVSNIVDNFDILITNHLLNETYKYAKKIDTINLSVDEPDITNNLTSGGAIYVRPDFVDEETWFNTVIHWFAPKGQDVMEIYATDKATGEKTQIRSYADFQAWKEAHPNQ